MRGASLVSLAGSILSTEATTMISRLWRGRTAAANADAYEELLRTKILPGIHRVDGYRGAYVLRRDVDGGVEFVTMTLFESMEAVRAFAGEDYETAVILPEAERLLAEADEKANHYEIVLRPA
jgi:heme-degrading monooxygenase HmoA